MLSLTVPYKAGHHTLGRVCVGEGLGSEEGYFMGRTGGGRGGKGARWHPGVLVAKVGYFGVKSTPHCAKAASASHPCELHCREMVRRGDGP